LQLVGVQQHSKTQALAISAVSYWASLARMQRGCSARLDYSLDSAIKPCNKPTAAHHVCYNPSHQVDAHGNLQGTGKFQDSIEGLPCHLQPTGKIVALVPR
jgi:hypothetical protein